MNPMTHKRRFAGTLAGILMAAAILTAQAPPVQPAPPVTFKMDINYVDVSVRVLDERGNFVPNLRQEDFRVLESKKAQTITAFGLISMPRDRPEKPLFLAQPIDADVVTTARANDGRLYVLALDDLHTDPLRSARVRNAARKFVEENLGAGDLGAVTIIGRSDAAQELTGNRRLLLAAIDKFLGQQPRSATLEKIEAYNRGVGIGAIDPGGDVSDQYLQERMANARRTFRSLARLTEWMGGVHGRRKALLYFSEGFGYDITDVFRSLDSATQPAKADVLELFDDTREVIGSATRNDVNIYAVDPRGLGAAGDELIEAGNLADTGMALNADDPNFGNNSGTFRPDLGARSLNRELETAQANLRMLSEETGGFATLTSNDFTGAFSKIVDQNSSYYVLGYYSKDEKRDGKYRPIEVRLINRPGLIVQARKGYLAPRGKTPTAAAVTDAAPDLSVQLRDLLRSPVPVRGLAFSATAATFKGSPANNTAVIAAEVPGKDLGLVAKDGILTGSLSIALGVIDADGKLRASAAPTLALRFRQDTYDQVLQNGSFRIVAQFALPPGRYQFRTAALTAEGKSSGAVQGDLEVDDFRKPRLSLSSLALTSTRSRVWPSAADKHIDATLPEPTTVREFSSSDELDLYFEVYDNESTAHATDIVSTVRGDAGEVVFKDEQQYAVGQNQTRHPVSVKIPLKSLSPGVYVLAVQATSRLGSPDSASRLLQFHIR
jgi:VWFA-related protein